MQQQDDLFDESFQQDLQPGQGVQRTEGFVGEQQLRSAHQRPGQGDPLLLAAAKLARPGVLASFEAHAGQRLAARAQRAGGVQPEGDSPRGVRPSPVP
ncbi:hypothetical protein [Azorhizophilus paspali]|uniref:Uncharacterized protein n=1 Tax=Azorhizophilus paspali TaxID=69963 RepID=A0ABV6SNE6_AZOPA